MDISRFRKTGLIYWGLNILAANMLLLCIPEYGVADFDGMLMNIRFPQEIRYTPGRAVEPKLTFTVKNTGDQSWTSCEVSDFPTTEYIPAYKIRITNLSWNANSTWTYLLITRIDPGESDQREWSLGDKFLPTEPGEYSFKTEFLYHATNDCTDRFEPMKGNNPVIIHFTLTLKEPVQSLPWLPLLLLDETEPEWITVMSENFEGTFPSSSWEISGDPAWGVDEFNPHSGAKSAWCAKGGTLGRDPAANNYANQMSTWMIYGPFDLSDATDAQLIFYLWLDSEQGYDFVKWMASINGTDFYGVESSGNTNGWVKKVFDLKSVFTIGNVCGKSRVWIAFYFASDSSVSYKGAFVDDLLLRKKMAGE